MPELSKELIETGQRLTKDIPFLGPIMGRLTESRPLTRFGKTLEAFYSDKRHRGLDRRTGRAYGREAEKLLDKPDTPENWFAVTYVGMNSLPPPAPNAGEWNHIGEELAKGGRDIRHRLPPGGNPFSSQQQQIANINAQTQTTTTSTSPVGRKNKYTQILEAQIEAAQKVAAKRPAVSQLSAAMPMLAVGAGIVLVALAFKR